MRETLETKQARVSSWKRETEALCLEVRKVRISLGKDLYEPWEKRLAEALDDYDLRLVNEIKRQAEELEERQAAAKVSK